MKSIKPGKGPSLLGAIGAVFSVIFGIIWCIIAGTSGAYIMLPFGIIFICMAIGIAIYNIYNATSNNRCSIFDIVETDEDGNQINYSFNDSKKIRSLNNTVRFCPYCGNSLSGEFKFCPGCGEELPK